METVEPNRSEAAVTLTNEVGLHARPAVRLTQEAAKFRSAIELSIDGGSVWHDAKSVVKVMRLKAKKGSDIRFRAHGSDADGAIASIVALVERRFEDG